MSAQPHIAKTAAPSDAPARALNAHPLRAISFGDPEVSVEEGLHERFHIDVGDSMRFDLLGRLIAEQFARPLAGGLEVAIGELVEDSVALPFELGDRAVEAVEFNADLLAFITS